jgi:hypothetical protein
MDLEIVAQQTVPCVVESIDYWKRDEQGNPVEQYGQYLGVRFDGEERERRYSIPKTLNGETPKVGQKVFLLLQEYIKSEGARDGSGRIFKSQKWRLAGAKAA